MPVDEPGVERILPGQRLAGEAVRLARARQTQEGREAAWQTGRSREGGEDGRRVEAGQTVEARR